MESIFVSKTYKITSDISLTADVANIKGNFIVKSKTIVLDYKGSEYKTSDCKSIIQKLIISNVLCPQYVVELINYLSRLINGENLFDVYRNKEDIYFDNKEDLNDYVFKQTDQQIIIIPRPGMIRL